MEMSPHQTLLVDPQRVVIVEMVAWVMLLHRALDLVAEALDLTVEPLRRIMEDSRVTAEEDSSKSKGDFKTCREDL